MAEGMSVATCFEFLFFEFFFEREKKSEFFYDVFPFLIDLQRKKSTHHRTAILFSHSCDAHRSRKSASGMTAGETKDITSTWMSASVT